MSRRRIVGVALAMTLAACGSPGPATTFGPTGTPAVTPMSTSTAAPPSVGPTASAGVAGFDLGPSMATGRYGHRAVLLADGRLLVLGGDDGEHVVRTAELADPETLAFSPTGDLGATRWYFSATLLMDGRVLIAGGQDRSGHDAIAVHRPGSAELYDPSTGAFAPTGPMLAARLAHTATKLVDGRVLVAGGSIGGRADDTLATAEVFDAAAERFMPTGSMGEARAGHTATLLGGGRVLVVGGSDNNGRSFASAEVYDPRTGTFEPTGATSVARVDHTATLLGDGRVLVVGGLDPGTQVFSTAEIYDPISGTFAATGSMSVGRYDHWAARLADGRVLVGGGDDDDGAPRVSVELFDPATGMFSASGPLALPRALPTANLLMDGRVLIVGGYGPEGVWSSSEVFELTPSG